LIVKKEKAKIIRYHTLNGVRLKSANQRLTHNNLDLSQIESVWGARALVFLLHSDGSSIKRIKTAISKSTVSNTITKTKAVGNHNVRFPNLVLPASAGEKVEKLKRYFSRSESENRFPTQEKKTLWQSAKAIPAPVQSAGCFRAFRFRNLISNLKY